MTEEKPPTDEDQAKREASALDKLKGAINSVLDEREAKANEQKEEKDKEEKEPEAKRTSNKPRNFLSELLGF